MRMTLNGPNLALNASTLAALLIALVVGGFVAADLYNTVQQIKQQSESNGMAVNQTISQILEGQEQGNKRGNITIAYFDKIFQRQLENEQNIIGNLTHHRIISNQSRDLQIGLLEKILNQTSH